MYKQSTQHIHFVGIGGIGMSGIAAILRTQGYHVSGCDGDINQKSVRDLIQAGCHISAGNNTPACHDTSIDVLDARLGASDLLVAEADESDKSFLKLYPALAVVTNIDLEHIDVYRDLDDIKASFLEFLNRIPFYGKAFVCTDDEHVRSILPLHNIKTISYGTTPSADLIAQDITLGAQYSTCTIWHKNNPTPLGSLFLTMPGKHNVLNATAATAVALDLGVPFATIAHALASFTGIDRRFSYKGTYRDALLFDDYGHHPTEIDCTLTVARKRAGSGKLIVAFQPHRYTRTAGLWQDFMTMFAAHTIDELIITDIYAASEQSIPHITSQRFVEELQQRVSFPVRYVPYDAGWTSMQVAVQEAVNPHDLVLFLGAGKINTVADLLKQNT